MSEVSKIYAQFADGLRVAQKDYHEDLRQHAELIVRLETLAYIEDDGHLSLPGWPRKVVWLNP